MFFYILFLLNIKLIYYLNYTAFLIASFLGKFSSIPILGYFIDLLSTLLRLRLHVMPKDSIYTRIMYPFCKECADFTGFLVAYLVGKELYKRFGWFRALWNPVWDRVGNFGYYARKGRIIRAGKCLVWGASGGGGKSNSGYGYPGRKYY